MSGSRAAIYARISKDKVGAGLGAERQRTDCQALADQLGWTVAGTYVDNDISAYSGKRRPEYLRLLADIESGAIDSVLVWHTDRLHRSPRELESYISVCEPRGVPTRTVRAGELDLSTASGRMTARISGAVARHESEHASERIQAQKSRAAASGEWIGGGRPFGYTRDGLHLVDDEADAVRDGVRRLLAGESVYSITKDWEGRVRPVRADRWQPVNVSRILASPRHAGLATHKGEVVGTGSWPAIISEDDHRAVAAILKDPSRSAYSGKRSLKWVGSGLYRCGVCGLDMRSATASDRHGTSRRTYRCRSTKHVHVNGDALDAYVLETVAALLDRDAADLMPTDDDRDAAAELHQEANTLRARLDELADMLGDGELDRAQYTRQRGRIEDRLAAVGAQLDGMRTGSALDGIATAEHPSAAFRAQPVARQRAIIDALVTITIGKAKPGRLPAGVDLDYTRVRIEPRGAVDAPA